MRLNDLLEDLVYDTPLLLALFVGGLVLWLMRARVGRQCATAAVILLLLGGLHVATGFSQRLLSDAINSRPPGDPHVWLSLGFSLARVVRAITVAFGVLILAHATLASFEPSHSPEVPT